MTPTEIMTPTEHLRKKVLQITLEAIKEVSSVGLNKYVVDLCSIAEKIVNNIIQIGIVGNFMSGKTTLANALVEEEVIPMTYEISIGGITTKLEYGIKKSAKILFRNPMPDKIYENINDSIKSHIEKHMHSTVPPLDIDINRFKEYIKIDYGKIDELLYNNPFEGIEIQYPADILKNNSIEIIDLLSINGFCDIHADKLLNLLQTVDSIIFLTDTTHAVTSMEKDFIENILVPMGFKDIIFVANRFDLIPHKEKEEAKKFINKRLSMYTKHEVSYISALLALEGKQGYDMEEKKLSEEERENALQKSGIIHFEELLKNHVMEQQKKKLIAHIRELRSIIKTNILFNDFSDLVDQKGKIDYDLVIKCKDNLYSISHRLDEIVFDFIEGK